MLRWMLIVTVMSCDGSGNLRDGSLSEPVDPVSASCLTPRDLTDPCMYYPDCLEAAISCEGSSSSYAISYGEKYCNKFSALSRSLSSNGQGWVSNTRTCLEELWPLSDSEQVAASCKQVRDAEFSGHALCYLGGPSPLSGVSYGSICNLELEDLEKIIDTVKTTILTSEGLSQMVEVGDRCLAQWAPLAASPTQADIDGRQTFWRLWRETFDILRGIADWL